MYREFSVQYIRQSVAGSSERTYGSGFQSWLNIRALIGCEPYLKPGESESAIIWVLIDFAAWFAAPGGNQAGSTSGRLAAVRYFHRVVLSLELRAKLVLMKSAFKGTSRSHTLAGTTRRVRRPMSWGMLLAGERLAPSWGGGHSVLCICLGMP